MELIQKHLNALQITDEETIIYLNSLETNASTVLEFAQNSGIPRTTVYLLVESLISKELLKEEQIGKKKRYIPASPQELIVLAKRKEEEYKNTAKALEHELSQLQAIYNRNSGSPKLIVKLGEKGIKEVFNESLESEVVLMHFMSETGHKILADLGESYYESYMKKMISTKQIIRNTTKNIAYQKEEATGRNQIVLMDEKYATNTDYMIYNDTVVFITYKDNQPYIIQIKDEEIAYFEKMRFNLLFNTYSAKLKE